MAPAEAGGRKAMRSEACPACGGGVFKGQVVARGAVSGVRECQWCGLWWMPGDAGRGWEWWSEVSGWTRAPEGMLTVLEGEER